MKKRSRCIKVLLMWILTVSESITATLIIPAYPILSGILYALALENIFRMADFYVEEDEKWDMS